MATPIEEIKDNLDIVEFIKGYLDVKPSGKNYKALCPFHNEKTPSFVISPDRQIWHCFGCGEGGDIFKFLMKYENLEFYEALQVLAEKAGIELKRVSPAEQRQFGILYELNKVASDYFEDKLKSSRAPLDYLKKRGLKEETIQDFNIGFAPNNSDELTLYLINRGFDVQDIMRAGLALKTERGKYIDRFRGRIIFPIHNHFGKIVGFSGRILPVFETEKTAKYLNSPDTPIFNKSRILYGFWQSKRYIQKAKEALLVEGQMDFLMAWQDGVKNVVATSGTALTTEHLRALRRITNKLVIGFDMDEAGQAAAERGIDLSGNQDFSVYILRLDEYGDPAEAVVKSPGFLKRALKHAGTAMEYYFDRYLGKNISDDIDKKKVAVRAILMKIGTLWSPVERMHWIGALAKRTDISEGSLIEEMEKITSGESSAQSSERFDGNEKTERRKLERRDMISEAILSLLVIRDTFREAVEEYKDFFPPVYKNAYLVISGSSEITPETKNIIDIVNLQSGLMFDDFSQEKLEKEMEVLLRELVLEKLKEEREVIKGRISSVEKHGDDEELNKELKAFDDILRKMQDIENAKEKKQRED